MTRVDEARRRAAALAEDPTRHDEALRDLEPIGPPRVFFPDEVGRLATMSADPAPVTPPVTDFHEHVQPAPLLFDRAQVIDSEGTSEKIVIDPQMRPEFREQYRKLAANLHEAQAATGLKVVMVASAVSGEGKTLTAANLALTFSESYHKSVLLIDSDLRSPSLNRLFGIDESSGLNEGLTSLEERSIPLYRITSLLTLLPAGRPNMDPMAPLTGRRMRRLIQEAREAFDWVVVDTPPVALLPDANLLSAMSDGAVLVIRAGETPYTLVQRAVEALGRDRIIGTVLNGAREVEGQDGYGRYYAAYRDAAAGRD